MRLYVCVVAIRVYRVVGDVGMVMALQTVKVRVSGTPCSFYTTSIGLLLHHCGCHWKNFDKMCRAYCFCL